MAFIYLVKKIKALFDQAIPFKKEANVDVYHQGCHACRNIIFKIIIFSNTVIFIFSH